MKHKIHINGLPLPPDLLALINTGKWKFPDDMTALNHIFPEHGRDFKLYTLDDMLHENASWLAEKRPMFIGAPDTVKAPGDIDPKLSVLIGDLGWGSDQPIALDYRCSMEIPRVLTLEWPGDGRNNQEFENNRWIELAPNILAFAELLGLNKVVPQS